MVDTSDYMIEYRVHTVSFYIEGDQTRHAMKLVRDRLHVKCDIEPLEHRVIKAWSNKLLETSSLFDKPRSERQTVVKRLELIQSLFSNVCGHYCVYFILLS